MNSNKRRHCWRRAGWDVISSPTLRRPPLLAMAERRRMSMQCCEEDKRPRLPEPRRQPCPARHDIAPAAVLAMYALAWLHYPCAPLHRTCVASHRGPFVRTAQCPSPHARPCCRSAPRPWPHQRPTMRSTPLPRPAIGVQCPFKLFHLVPFPSLDDVSCVLRELTWSISFQFLPHYVRKAHRRRG